MEEEYADVLADDAVPSGGGAWSAAQAGALQHRSREAATERSVEH